MGCLAAHPQSCWGYAGEPSVGAPAVKGPRTAGYVDVILTWGASGVTGGAAYGAVNYIGKRADKSFITMIKYLYHGGKLYNTEKAGQCDGDFGNERDAILADCKSPHGVYFQTHNAGPDYIYTVYDTETEKPEISPSNIRGADIFDAPPHDYVKWQLKEIESD